MCSHVILGKNLVKNCSEFSRPNAEGGGGRSRTILVGGKKVTSLRQYREMSLGRMECRISEFSAGTENLLSIWSRPLNATFTEIAAVVYVRRLHVPRHKYE